MTASIFAFTAGDGGDAASAPNDPVGVRSIERKRIANLTETQRGMHEIQRMNTCPFPLFGGSVALNVANLPKRPGVQESSKLRSLGLDEQDNVPRNG
jgi:hypothetical protein